MRLGCGRDGTDGSSGIAWGAEDSLRIRYATGLANLGKRLDRLDRFVRGLKK